MARFSRVKVPCVFGPGNLSRRFAWRVEKKRRRSGTNKVARVSHQVVGRIECGDDLSPEVVAVESFEDFYRRTWGLMVRLARLLVDDREEAVEAVQDAFSRMYPKFGRIEAGSTDAYLRAAVLNGCRRHLRRRRLSLLHRPAVFDYADLGADHMIDAVRRLAPDRRDVVLLRYYLDLPEAEIARTLNVAPGTVKSRLHRALRDLREALR
jgi:RNA polymerase sigma factor (sigma-70 family)